MPRLVRTTYFSRGKLPHWEVEGGVYFITARCADSLPLAVVGRLSEIQQSLQAIPANSPQFAAEQRRYFRMVEKYLDAGLGECFLRRDDCARILVKELEALSDLGMEVRHFCVMPNHWHALFHSNGNELRLVDVMKRVKGRTAKAIRKRVGGAGAFWQREWFDRWIRDDDEYERTVNYIRNNPVKAGLVEQWQNWPWTK